MARKLNLALNKFRPQRKQKGIVLILFAFLIGLATTAFAIKILSGNSLKMQQDVATTEALTAAKLATVSYIISNNTNVGLFPCSEDTLAIGGTSEGQALGSCSNIETSIGRWAWRTLGSGPIDDGNSDKLWYALSAGFRAAPVNSDSIATLAVNGAQNAAIALIMSSGTALSSQTRATLSAVSPPVVSNYLDGENSDIDADFATGAPSTTFNDQLIAIKPDDVFPTIEKRVLGEIKNYLLAYKSKWGAYPFPASFTTPSTASYIGSRFNTGGLLPIGDAGVTWLSGTATSVRASNGAIRNGTCTSSLANQVLTCTITGQNYNGGRTITINASLNNVGLGFYKQMDTTSYSDFTIAPAVLRSKLSITHSLNSTGGGSITLQGTSTTRTGTYTVIFMQPPQLDSWNVTTAISNYIYKNNWHYLTYYKVAAPFLPGGNVTCGAACLTVNTINVTPSTTVTGAHALLMSAGRKLDTTVVLQAPVYGATNPAQIRPSSSLDGYFDSSNNIAAGLIFDSTNQPLPTFNDQVKIVE